MTKDHLQLLTFSQGVVADYERKNSIGSFLAPEVVVGGGIYHYKDYGLGNAFTAIDMRRAIGGPSKMLHLSVNDLQDINVEYSLATFIDDQERENNPANISVLEQRKMTDLVNTAMNNNLYLVLAQARTLTAFTVGSGANQIPAPFSGGGLGTTTKNTGYHINLVCKKIRDKNRVFSKPHHIV